MPASITGIVFDDVNGNGIYDGGEPGIPNAYIILEDPNGICVRTQTDALGNYSFTNLTIPGTYNVYEVVTGPGFICPPTTFIQPDGFNSSTTPRTITLTITATDIANNVVFANQNFGHETITMWECDPNGLQVAGVPSSLFSIDLVTGAATNLGLLSPITSYNSIGFNSIDNTIWGINFNSNRPAVARINTDLTVSIFSVEGLPTPTTYIAGDVDFNGYLYLYRQSRIYVVDVNPNSATFLRQVDPTNGFIVDTPPYGIPTNIGIPDWAFNPVDQQLYGVGGSSVIRWDPLTGVATVIPTVGVPASGYGAVFFDIEGSLYAIRNDNGNIYRITFSGLNATGVLFSTTIPAANNDGARCVFAPLV
ncbi:hypothetical protein CAI16_20010, partial [Virgibacillus dokdonensis]